MLDVRGKACSGKNRHWQHNLYYITLPWQHQNSLNYWRLLFPQSTSILVYKYLPINILIINILSISNKSKWIVLNIIWCFFFFFFTMCLVTSFWMDCLLEPILGTHVCLFPVSLIPPVWRHSTMNCVSKT